MIAGPPPFPCSQNNFFISVVREKDNLRPPLHGGSEGQWLIAVEKANILSVKIPSFFFSVCLLILRNDK